MLDSARYAYATDMIRQGMSVQGAAQAAGVTAPTLRAIGVPCRPARVEYSPPAAPVVEEQPDPIGPIAARLPWLGRHDLRRVMAMCEILLSARVRAGTGRRSPRAEKIIEEIALAHEVAVADLLGPSRSRRFSIPRQEAYWRIRQELNYSMPRIGDLFGRDHTTILHGVRAHQVRMAREACR